jgi:AraC-like DNA-binding protein
VVGSAIALMHREPGRPWGVDSLARAVGAHLTAFTRRFVRLTGQAPMTYLTSWRMSVASRLLREEHHPLREIARRVGYDSEFAFARAFKRTVGQAPGRYRAAVGDREPWHGAHPRPASGS